MCDPPTRLIEVVSQNGREPRLVYSSDLAEQHPEYAALSYCWGDTLPICTLRATEPEFRTQIPYRTLPRTFQDAIDIVRVLHLPYIWIDALCIVQEDYEDWEKEATRMQQIYSGSTLTIAASGAKDASGGFFAHELPRFRAASVPVERAYFTVLNSTTGKRMIVQVQDRGGVSTGMTPILQTRGLTLQESVLSNRIVQCVQSELYWRCNQGCQTESGIVLPTTADFSWNVPVLDLKDLSESYNLWWRLMEDYSGRAFTFRKDRLPAMAGLISYFQEHINDSPILGLWKRNFPRDLTWMRVGRLENNQVSSDNELKFPSWTWLCCSVTVEFEPAAENASFGPTDIPVSVNEHVEVIDWQVTWQSRPFTSMLKTTQLFLEDPLKELFIEIPAESKTFNPPYCIINGKVPKDSKRSIPWRSTVQFDAEDWKPAKKWVCLLLQSIVYPGEQRERREDTFLLLEPVSSGPEPDTFRRVGIGISRDYVEAFSAAVSQAFHMM